MKISNQTKLVIAVGLIVLAVVLRYAPHPPNFAPIAAIGLFAGVYLPRRYAIILPLAAMVISDLFLGFHGLIFWTWGSFIAIGLYSALVLRKNHSLSMIIASSVGASIFFYLVTNFGVWVEGTLYPPTIAGLTSSYVNALPFLRNTLAGDAFYTLGIFAIYELAVYYSSQAKAKLTHA